ncbi:hypothetical protein TcWFU_002410 [Taenia crassiceps]|uniref:Transmembrane protein n=1 Tax=Taenia crassiceps TaxID=6207 RepID=A0ABR4QCU8_9CEST
MSDKEKLTRMYMPFYAACGFTATGFILFLFSFSSIWEWLNPYWLVAIQTLIIIAFVAELISVLILILYFLLYGQPAAESTIVCGLQIFIGLLLSISLVVFGVNSQNRMWMQRPDHMFLSWSFGFLILATIASFISAAFLCCVSYTDRAAQREVEYYEAVEGQLGSRSLAAGTYLAGRQPSTLFTRSIYGNQSRMGGGVVVSVPAPGDAPTQTIEIGTTDFYSGDGPTGSQLSPLREDPLVDDGTFGDQDSGTYASSGNVGTHQPLNWGRYPNNDTPTNTLLYGYHRGQA